MIYIQRCSVPASLTGRSKAKDRYRKKDVILALWNMQHNKCSYCEAIIPSEGHAKAVEHIIPKTHFDELKNDWENLLLACSQCNGQKSDKYPVMILGKKCDVGVVKSNITTPLEALIIDPSKDDPEQYLDYDFGDGAVNSDAGIIMAKDNCDIGLTTIDAIDLCSKFYSDRRNRYFRHTVLKEIEVLAEAVSLKDDEMLSRSKDRLNLMMSNKSEFAGFVRAFVREKRLDKKPVELIIP